MIAINLLKRAPSGRGSKGVGIGRILTAGVLGLAVVVVGAGLMWWLLEHPRIRRTVPDAAAAETGPGKGAAIPAAAPAAAARTEQKTGPSPAPAVPPATEREPAAHAVAAPRTVLRREGVPDIATVPSLRGTKKAAPAPSPRAHVAAPRRVDPAQKIANDIAFVKNALKKLAVAVPEGIGFETLSIDGFSTVTGIGTAATRDLVSSLFLNLRREQLNVLGHPDSYIGRNDDDGYSFVFVCRPSFGDAPAGAVRSRSNLVPRKRMSRVIKTFSKTAVRNRIILKKGLSRTGVKRAGGYAHNIYRLSCSGTYRNFATFVIELERARVLCAFKSVRFKARGAGVVDINADVDFITRE